MHVLRSTYFPAYESLVRAPYTSDPFPSTSQISSAFPIAPATPTTPTTPPLPSSSSSLTSPPHPSQPSLSLQRETKVLDLFIALKVREDVWMDESELHLEREESFKDVFDLMQPRARVEDLVRAAGVREGVINVSGSGSLHSKVS